MNKLEKITKALKINSIIFGIAIYVLLLVSAGKNDLYSKLDINWFDYIFNVPFIEITRILNLKIDFRASYFLVFFTSALIFTFIERYVFRYFKDIILAYFKVIKAYKRKDYASEEEKIDKMFEPLEEANFSFTKIILSIFSMFLYYGIIRTFFSLIFKDNIISLYNVSSFEVLWFNLNGSENIPILFISYLLLSFGASVVFFIIRLIKARKMDDFKAKKEYLIYNLIISFSLHTLLIYSVYKSAIFALFICFISLISLILQIIKLHKKV